MNCSDALCLHLLSGTYSGSGNTGIALGSANLQLDSLAGPQNTIIDCQGSRQGFSLMTAQTPDTLIAGLTMAHCMTPNGGGAISITGGAPRIHRMVFANNTAQLSGGAISLQASAVNVTAIQASTPARHALQYLCRNRLHDVNDFGSPR